MISKKLLKVLALVVCLAVSGSYLAACAADASASGNSSSVQRRGYDK